MIVPFVLEDSDKIHYCRDIDREVKLGYGKVGDILMVIPEDFIDENPSTIYAIRVFIDKKFDKSHEQYNFLKELIYSEDKDNLIIALTIINGL